MLIRMGWLDAARLLFGRLTRRFGGKRGAEELVQRHEAFFQHLRGSGFPASGETIMVFDDVAHKQRFAAAVAFALMKLDKGTSSGG